ncbi:MAG: hypothetical protein IJL92_00365 [Thermoguttaceae bacterium]|nr:hypothetical protein [Thermoguttaceae bacterium]
MKAIVLFSGGLDSILAACLLKRQGIEVVGLNMITPFHDCSQEAQKRAEEIGIELVVKSFGEDYMKMLAHPKWGYGSNVNPCIDCRTLMLRYAKELMEEIGADFVATGEIAGQRPNSQKIHQLTLITRDSGLGGKLLRPLSARVLPKTDMEIEGTIDREQMRAFSGRGRTKLSAYARQEYGIKNIPQPSSGCVLCENSFSPRVRDMLKHKELPTLWDARLTPWGRRLRIDENAYVVVARRSEDCEKLDELFASPERSRCVLIFPENFNGASALLVTDEAPDFGDENPTISERLKGYVEISGSLALRFSNPARYNASPDGPMAKLFLGQTSTLISLHENHAVDEIPIIAEPNRPPKKKGAQDSSADEAPREDESLGD